MAAIYTPAQVTVVNGTLEKEIFSIRYAGSLSHQCHSSTCTNPSFVDVVWDENAQKEITRVAQNSLKLAVINDRGERKCYHMGCHTNANELPTHLRFNLFNVTLMTNGCLLLSRLDKL